MHQFFLGFNSHYVIISSVSDLNHNRQAINSSNDEPLHWRISASPKLWGSLASIKTLAHGILITQFGVKISQWWHLMINRFQYKICRNIFSLTKLHFKLLSSNLSPFVEINSSIISFISPTNNAPGCSIIFLQENAFESVVCQNGGVKNFCSGGDEFMKVALHSPTSHWTSVCINHFSTYAGKCLVQCDNALWLLWIKWCWEYYRSSYSHWWLISILVQWNSVDYDTDK